MDELLGIFLALITSGVSPGAAANADTIDPRNPQFQAKVEACEAQVGEQPDEAELFRCLGLEERYKSCKALETGGQSAGFLGCMGFETPFSMPLRKLREGIELRHPSDMLILAQRTFEDGSQRREGLFWFYASQLRWRTRLACRDFPPGGEGALYGAMFATLGPMFNEWASENIDVWLSTLDDVHAWDIATKARFAEDEDCLVQAGEQRAGMLELKQSIIDNREELEAKASERREGAGTAD